MRRSQPLRCLVIGLLAAMILLTAGSSMASSQDPPAAIVSRTGQATMTGGGYALIYQLQRAAGASVSQPTILASGGGYRLMAPAQPAADGTGCCCKCRLPLILKK
jgi:hypothetical protein